MSTVTPSTLMLSDIADAAGYPAGPDGKLSLPNTQECADRLAETARSIVVGGSQWQPGDQPVPPIDLSGAGPVWAYLAIAHALHGLTPELRYVSPAATITIHRHSA
jgi:hypothetical protein